MKKLIILIICAICVSLYSSNNNFVEVPSTSIRMRVIANSNNKKDQSDKLVVKEKLESVIYDITSKSSNYNDIDNIINDNKEMIDNKLIKTMKEKNINTSFSSKYGMNYFPEKEFKNVVYPAGNYKSYVVTLGDGLGENWWCVLYPPLCLIDENKDTYEYRSLIKDTLSQYN